MNETQTEGQKKEDRRVRRTKKLLTQALTKLMQEKQIKEITVKELTELADMNRGTFYLYYKDIYDMLKKIEDSMFAALGNIIGQHENEELLTGIRPILKDLFDFISENREMCQVLLSENGDMTFLHRLNELVREKCRVYWNSQSGSVDEIEYDYYYNFCVFGCAGLIRSWLSNGCREEPAQMAALAERMLRLGTLGGA